MDRDSKAELHGAITAKAELDRTVSRLIIEDVTSVMSQNLSTLLKVMEAQHTEAMAAINAGAARMKKLEARQLRLEQNTLDDMLNRDKRLALTLALEKIAPHVDTLVAIAERERGDGD